MAGAEDRPEPRNSGDGRSAPRGGAHPAEASGSPAPPAVPGRTDDGLEKLLRAAVDISRDLELPEVLRRIVTTAMELVGARYGALGVLHADGERLERFITAGLTERERADLAGIDFPHGRGVLGHVIRHPEPVRLEDIAAHPDSVGFPPGHPRMRTLLGVSIRVRGRVYGDLYLTERRDGRPFDGTDEDIIVALAGAAGIAIENARLYGDLRDSAEKFQRLLLPSLPDLRPFGAAAVYRPAAAPHRLGGDWYDAVLLPDDACAAVIGDVQGHDLRAAAAMAQTRNMLRALLYDRRTPPSGVLDRLDHALRDITELPVTTACLARIEPDVHGRRLHWSSAGHVPPLLVGPDGRAEFLDAEPGLPLGVEPGHIRPDHLRPLPPGTTVVLFTDGLVEHAERPLDAGMAALARLAEEHAALEPGEFVTVLADRRPGDDRDDLAVLALRTPAPPRPPT